ncbi:MAG: hypothetical protein ACXVLQ_05315 [Bacteriovorax sp.]
MPTIKICCLMFLHLFSVYTMAADKSVLSYEKVENLPSAYFNLKDKAKFEKFLISTNRSIDVMVEKFTEKIEDLRNGNLEEGQLFQELAPFVLYTGAMRRDRINDINKRYSALLAIVRTKKIIDDVEYRSLLDELKFELDQLSSGGDVEDPSEMVNKSPMISIRDYHQKLELLLKDPKEEAKRVDLVMPLKSFGVKLVPGVDKYTPREKLYIKYSPMQIRAMSEILSYTLKIMSGVKTSIVVETEKSQKIVLDVSLTDQYRLALREYNLKKKEYEQNGAKLGVACDDIDILMASLELGVISKEEVAGLLNNPDFYRPDVPNWNKILHYAGNLAVMGLQINPTTAPFVVVPLLVYRSYMAAKDQINKQDEDLFLFTLPEKK